MSFNMDKVVLWNAFKEQVLMGFDESPPFEVDLSFEYKDRNGKVVSMSSGDLLHITDIKFTSADRAKLYFEVPHGAECRFIELQYAENISNPVLGELDCFVSKAYQSALKTTGFTDQPECLSAFVDGIKPHEVNSFNNSAEWIKSTIEAEKDKASFETMDKFGLF